MQSHARNYGGAYRFPGASHKVRCYVYLCSAASSQQDPLDHALSQQQVLHEPHIPIPTTIAGETPHCGIICS